MIFYRNEPRLYFEQQPNKTWADYVKCLRNRVPTEEAENVHRYCQLIGKSLSQKKLSS